MTAGYDGNVILWDAVAHIDRWVVQISGQVYHVNIINRVYFLFLTKSKTSGTVSNVSCGFLFYKS